MQRFEEAFTDLNRALGLDEKNSWALAMRGEVYRQMGHYEEALNDFDLSIALDEKYGWPIARREETRQQMKRTQDEKELASGSSGDLEDPTMRVAPSWASTAYEDSTNAGHDFSPEPSIPYRSSPPPKYQNQPGIPTWQDPSQGIPFVGTPIATSTPLQGSQQVYGQPPIPQVAPTPLAPSTPPVGPPPPPSPFKLPDTPPIPAIAPEQRRMRFSLPVVIGVLVLLVLVVLVLLGFVFHVL